MSIMDTDPLPAAVESSRPKAIRLRATDVTGSLEIETDLEPSMAAGTVARTLAQQMELPSDVPWALRNDRGAFLDDERQIGEQLDAEARVTLTPKTHLG